MTVYALLVGIDAYADRSLSGAVADVRAVAEFLGERAPGCRIRSLCDGDARRDAVIDGIRGHLGQAVAGDVALMWFSGHGGEEAVGDAYWTVEPYAHQQSFVCSDSRRIGPDGARVPDLLDKEFDLRLAEVAVRGSHVVAVADCCHAAGVTRDARDVSVRGLGRAVGPLPVSSYLPELADHRPSATPTHVLLAACGIEQVAEELRFGRAVDTCTGCSSTRCSVRCAPWNPPPPIGCCRRELFPVEWALWSVNDLSTGMLMERFYRLPPAWGRGHRRGCDDTGPCAAPSSAVASRGDVDGRRCVRPAIDRRGARHAGPRTG